jgi:hypothetical protein
MGLCDHISSCTISNQFAAQGTDMLGGLGLLEDHKGNDHYHAASVERLDVSLHDQLSQPTAPPDLEVHSFLPAMIYAQGAGMGFGHGDGALIDHEGDDTYVARSVNSTSATASSDHASGTPRVVAMPQHGLGRLFIGAQGEQRPGETETWGALLDLDGTNDSFTAVSEVPITTSPDPTGALQGGYDWSHFQGSSEGGILGGGIFVALGDHPTMVSSPARPVCSQSAGLRGSSSWFECAAWGEDPAHSPIDNWGNGQAFGYAPNATGVSPVISFTAATPSRASTGTSVPVQVALHAADGTPLAGQAVRVDLESRFCPPAPTTVPCSWQNQSERQGTTDVNGLATIQVPAGVSLFDDPGNLQFQLYASYDGSLSGFCPAYAATPMTLIDG